MGDSTYSSTVGSNGEATITFTPTKNRPWNLLQVSTEMIDAPAGATAELRKNGSLVTRLLPNDVADSDPPVPAVPGDRLQVKWAGGTSGGVVSLYIIYKEIEWDEL